MNDDVVLIDLDDTCIPDRAATEAALASVLAEWGLPADVAAVDGVLAAARERWRAGPFYPYCLQIGISSWEGLWVQSPSRPDGFSAWVVSYQHDVWAAAVGGSKAAAASVHYRRARARHGLVYADVPPTLTKLAVDHSLWLMTNGESGLQRMKVELAELWPYFEALFVSGDTGTAKPADAFFRPIETRLRREGRAVRLVVGDSLDNDIRPALTRGWPAALLRRRGPSLTDGRFACISSFDAVGELVANGDKGRDM